MPLAETRRQAVRVRSRWIRRAKSWALKEHRGIDDGDLQTVIKFVESHGCWQCVSHRQKFRRPEPRALNWDLSGHEQRAVPTARLIDLGQTQGTHSQ